MLFGTDQEGGLVQRMRGPGFTYIPSAVDQGTSRRRRWRVMPLWGSELQQAGINVDLAPVLDTVPLGFGPTRRSATSTASTAIPLRRCCARPRCCSRARAAGVVATAKHFPGLGRVSGNTDTTSGVTDYVTTSTDPYLAPFAAAVDAGVPFVMMSTAIYAQIDPAHAGSFSSTIVTGMLRRRPRLRRAWSSATTWARPHRWPLRRSGNARVDFIAAGGDIVLTVVAARRRP